MNPAIEYYENIISKTVLRAYDFYGCPAYKHYGHKNSLHSFTTAFGVPQPRLCAFCDDKATAKFAIENTAAGQNKQPRYLLKIVASWLDWKQFVQPAAIILNGHALVDGEFFLENVCKGWPGIYITVLPELLAPQNELVIINKSGGNTLLIERVELLRLKDAEDFKVWYCPDFVFSSSKFKIKLKLFKKYSRIDVKCDSRVIEFIRRRDDEFTFKAKRPASGVKVSFSAESKKCRALIDDILVKPQGREIFVGMDGDDHRQDGTEELDRVLEHFTYTQMGNFYAFRPKPNRNYPGKFPASLKTWQRWIDFCKSNDVRFQFSGLPEIKPAALTILKKEIVRRGGKHFAGFQIHEPYCYSFSSVIKNPPAIARARDFDQKKRAYLDFVNAQTDALKTGNSRMFCGDPSLLCVYLKESKIESILCEPVSNSALLYGAARGTGKDFGAHVAPDWYCGFPHDQQAIKRMSLLLNLNYAYGGKHIYLESTAFKTNAFSRNDWEDEFCRSARQTLRDFYRFTCTDGRIGTPDVPLAFVFGNYESMFWRPDDRIPELADSGNWDDVVWGKWPNTEYRWLWKASDAWLPPLDFEDFGKNESLTKMFSGTPFGQVDLVSPFTDLRRYKAIAFLGWNSMNERIYTNLVNYVKQGGTVFMCGCHFDTRIDFKGSPRFLRQGDISELAGVKIAGPGSKAFGKRLCKLTDVNARQKGEFLYEHMVGKGKVYFFNFYDYPSDQQLVKQVQTVVEGIGRDVAENSDIKLEGPAGRFINYNLWRNGSEKKLYLVNVDWQTGPAKEVVINDNGKRTKVAVPCGEMILMKL